jgi:hypothetical protein
MSGREATDKFSVVGRAREDSMADTLGSLLLPLSATATKRLSTTAAERLLNDLFQWAPSKTTYSGNFLTLLTIPDIPAATKASFVGKPQGATVFYPPYTLADKDATIALLQPPAVANMLMTGLVEHHVIFAAPGQGGIIDKTIKKEDLSKAIFVVLNGFGIPVPFDVFKIIQANFINGLVTRLLLGEFFRIWGKYPDMAGLKTDLLLLGDLNVTAMIADRYQYTQLYSENWAKGDSFDDIVAKTEGNDPLAPAGILWGWHAGDELDALQDSDDIHWRNDVWKLLIARYSLEDIGQMMSFTLNYFIGFLKNERIKSSATADDPQVTDDATLLSQLAGDENIVLAKTLLANIHAILVTEFYVFSHSDARPPVERVRISAAYTAFLRGFFKGGIAAADQLYDEVFRLGFGIGYRTGYRDGYAAGFKAGYQVGYAKAYADTWAVANRIIDGLHTQIGLLRSQLDSAQERLAQTQQRLDEVQGELVQAQQRLAQNQQQAAANAAQIAQDKEQIQQAQQQIGQLQQQLAGGGGGGGGIDFGKIIEAAGPVITTILSFL